MKQFSLRTIGTELLSLWHLAWPVVTSYLVQQAFDLISFLVVGRLGATPLAVTALGFLTSNVTGASIIFGLCSAVDTLAAQAYGAKQYKLVGTIAQRALLIILLACTPVVGIWWYAAEILIFLGQDPVLARDASSFLFHLLPALVPMAIFEVAKKFLQVQGITAPAMWSSVLALPVCAVANWLLVVESGMGPDGAALANVVGNSAICLFLLTYILYSGVHKQCWSGFSSAALRDWMVFLRVGVPGMLMLMCEWWAYEFMALFAGMIGTVSLAVNTVMMNTMSLAFMFPMGISVAIATRVGNALGARQPSRASFSAGVGLFLGWSVAIYFALVLMAAHRLWGLLFTGDMRVVLMTIPLVPFISLSLLLDQTQGICGGVISGCGMQSYGAVLNIAGYYAIGLPIGYYLAFWREWSLIGLWSGLLCGQLVVCAVYFWIMARMKWEECADRACALVESQVDGISGISEDGIKVDLEYGGIEVVDEEVEEEISLLKAKAMAKRAVRSNGNANPNPHHVIGIGINHPNPKGKGGFASESEYALLTPIDLELGHGLALDRGFRGSAAARGSMDKRKSMD